MRTIDDFDLRLSSLRVLRSRRWRNYRLSRVNFAGKNKEFHNDAALNDRFMGKLGKPVWQPCLGYPLCRSAPQPLCPKPLYSNREFPVASASESPGELRTLLCNSETPTFGSLSDIGTSQGADRCRGGKERIAIVGISSSLRSIPFPDTVHAHADFTYTVLTRDYATR